MTMNFKSSLFKDMDDQVSQYLHEDEKTEKSNGMATILQIDSGD